MAYDLRATLKLTDEFTTPIRNAMRMFDRLESSMRQTDSMWNNIERSAQQAGNQVQNFNNHTSQSSQHVLNLQQELERARQEAERLGDAGGGAGGDMDNLGNQGQNAGNKISGAFKTAAGIIASLIAVDQIKDLGVGMIQAAADSKAMSAQFSEVFGSMEGEAAGKLGAIAAETTILENRMKGSFTKIAAFAKTGGMDTADSLDLADRSMRVIADSAAFYDKALDDTTESLQSFLKGNFENDAALGLSATETTRNAAANEAFGKSFKDLSEAQKQLTLLQMVEDANKISGAMGMAAKESDGFENVVGNLNQSWKDLKAVIGAPIMDKAIEQMVSLTHWLGRVDGQKIIDALLGAAVYLDETFSPLLGEITEDIEAVWAVLTGGEVESGLKATFEGIQTSMQWFGDNWEGIKDGVVALTGAYIAYNAALLGGMILGPLNTLIRLYNTGMLLAFIQTNLLTGAQWLLNTAMSANPIGIVAVAIGALVGAGILLYQNWDTVRAKTEQLWDKLGAFQGVATLVLGPIGFIIKAAVTMADQWDSTKGVWENVWNGIVSATESSVNTVIESINWLIETINKIPGVNIPIIPKVDWTPLDRITSGGVDGGGLGAGMGMGVQGSHATGLASVPHDGYIAELHKGEPVLTAQQGNILRGMGVLKSSGDKPVINTGALAGQRTGTGKTMSRGQARKASGFVFNGDIIINGANKTTKEMARELVDELKYVISAGALG